MARLDAAGAHGPLDAGTRGRLEHLLGRVRDPAVLEHLKAAVAHEVVITHDGQLLFAYAPTEAALAAARAAIEGVLQQDGITASISVSHWDEQRDAWRQIDPPPSAEETEAEQAVEREGEEIQTRTLVASSGNLVRSDFEQSMLDWAAKLGVQCTLIEHPHLLTTQVGFTITGPKRKLDEFSAGLKAEGTATMRADGILMLSPL